MPTVTTLIRRRPLGAILMILALTSAACGNRLTTEEVLAQNGVEPSADGSVEPVAAGGTAGPDGAPTGGPVTSAVGGGGSGLAPGSTVPGVVGAVDLSTGAGETPTAGSGETGAPIGTPGEAGPIVLGLVGTLAGPAGLLNVPLAQAVQAWAENTNTNGGLFGRQVQVIRVDDGGDPARHVAALRDLVENRGVVAFVGNASQFANAAGRPYIEQVGVPVIGPSCDVESVEASPLFFSQCPAFDDLVENIFRAQLQYGQGRRLAVLFCGEAEPCRGGARLAQERAPAVGMEVVYVAQTSLAQPDFTSECITARDRGADVMFTSTDPNSFIRIADACARQNYFPEFVAGGNTATNVRENRGLENMLMSVATFPFVGSQTPAAQEFEQVYPDATGDDAGAYAAMGWVAAQMFEEAATRAAQTSHSISPQTLVAALRTFQGETLGGLSVPLSFGPGGGVLNASCYWAVRAGPDGWTALNGPEPICS